MLEAEKLASGADAEHRAAALDAYFGLLDMLSELLKQQAGYDVDSLERASGRTLSAADRERVTRAQHRSYVDTWIVLGLKNASFVRFLKRVFDMPPSRAAEAAARFESAGAS